MLIWKIVKQLCEMVAFLNIANYTMWSFKAWSVLQFGYFKGNFVGNEKFQALNQVLDRLAIKYGVTSSTIAISWILRYPAKMQAIVGTTNPKHLIEASQATNFSLTRKEWYEIYLAAGNNLP